MNVSPFDKLLPDAENSIVSAPNRRAAREKLVRVRVEFSKKRLQTVLPGNTETFCRQPPVASLKANAVSSTTRISSAERLSKSSKWRRVQTSGMATKSALTVLMKSTGTPQDML